jgi:thiamine biosynthesis protein ThiS
MPPIEVSINGNALLMPAATTIETALKASGYQVERAAVALNETVVLRDEYSTRVLQAGDRVEVLVPFAGG